ncbi:MAG: hypothetical protein ACOCVL_03465 [Candidatus Sumerlaeota bacterium]
MGEIAHSTCLKRRAGIAGLAVLLCALGAFAWFFYAQRHVHVDDAFITYRFGQRLAEQGTLRWNIRPLDRFDHLDDATRRMLERPVEGYSSFLAVLISAGFIKAGFSPLTAWKAFGFLLALLSTLAIALGARNWLKSRQASGAMVCFVPMFLAAFHLANPLTAMHAASGMETILYVTILLALAALSLQVAVDQGRGRAVWFFGGLGLLLGMTRPDGVLWFVVVSIALFFSLKPQGSFLGGARRRLSISITGGFILPGAVYFLWRVWYFGHLLPATFHAKAAGAERPSPLGRLYTYLPSHWELWQYLRDYWLVFFFLFAILCIFVFAVRRSTTRRGLRYISRRWFVVIGLFCASFLCLSFYARVLLLMGFGWRFFYPFGQVLLLGLIVPIFVLIDRLRVSRVLHYSAVALFSLAFVWTGANIATRMLGVGAGPALTPAVEKSSRPYKRLGMVLEDVALRVDKQLLVYHHNVGELFYFAPHTDTVDPVGLVDLPMALEGFSVEGVVERRADILLLPSPSRSEVQPKNYVFGIAGVEVFPDISRSVYDHPMTRAEYTHLGVYTEHRFGKGGGIHVLVRNDLLRENPWMASLLQEELDLLPVE